MENSTPSSPSQLEALMASEKSTAFETLGVSIVEITAQHLILAMPVTPKVCQPAGLLHGGMSMFLAESAASLHCCSLIDLRETLPVGIEINGSHVASASEGVVRAIARPLNRSRTLIVHEVDIVHAESGRLLCKARVTNYLKRISQDSPVAEPGTLHMNVVLE